MNIFTLFQARVTDILSAMQEEGRLPSDLDLGRFTVEPPRDLSHGDLAINAAMVYAKESKTHFPNPRQLAVEIAALLVDTDGVDQAEVAGPGFINVRLKPEVYAVLLRAAILDPAGFAGDPILTKACPSTSNTCRQTQRGRCMWGTAAAQSSATP